MINCDVIENNVRALVNTLLGVNTILSYQAVPRPEGEYLTCELLNMVQIGKTEEEKPDGSGNADVFALYQLTFSFQNYRSQSGKLLQKLRYLFNKRTVLDQFLNISLSFVNAGALISVPQLLDTSWERRYNMDVVFYVGDKETDDVSYIESTQITGDLKNYSGEIKDEIVITINT